MVSNLVTIVTNYFLSLKLVYMQIHNTKNLEQVMGRDPISYLIIIPF